MLLETSPLGSNALVVRVRADQLDASTAPAFREATVGLDPARRFMVLDLSSVRFVDSSGLSGLLALQRHLLSRNVRLSVCGLTRTVQALFELMQVERLIEIFDTSESAASHLASLGDE